MKPITPLVTEHEKNKNDEIFDEEDSEIEDYDNPKYQYDDDDSDDNLVWVINCIFLCYYNVNIITTGHNPKEIGQ